MGIEGVSGRISSLMNGAKSMARSDWRGSVKFGSLIESGMRDSMEVMSLASGSGVEGDESGLTSGVADFSDRFDGADGLNWEASDILDEPAGMPAVPVAGFGERGVPCGRRGVGMSSSMRGRRLGA